MPQGIHALPPGNARRSALAQSGVHVQRMAGIHGDAELGAYSICMSKGYEDNVDRGNTMYVRLPSHLLM
jgi:hypothetical protein